MLKPLRGVVRTWSGEWRSPDDPLGAVEAVWEQAAGQDVAGNAQPARLLDGELLIVAASSAWSQQLALLAPQIVAALRERVPGGEGRSPSLPDRPRIQAHTLVGPAPRESGECARARTAPAAACASRACR